MSDYEKIRTVDKSRPVFLNLGQGVAWEEYRGRGVRRGHLEDYQKYIKGCDIASFDIYPVVHRSSKVADKLEFVAKGVDNLLQWSKGDKIVWNCIECSRISNVDVKPNVYQVKAEVWMSIIHGSRGIIYFVHQFKPEFKEASLFDDPELLKGVTEINKQIHALSPVLNSPTLNDEVTAEFSDSEVPVDIMVKRHDEAVYVFAVCMRNRPTKRAFRLMKGPKTGTVTVLGENRSIALRKTTFEDHFKPYEVHLYKVK